MGRWTLVAIALLLCSTGAHAVPVEKAGHYSGPLTELPCSVRVDFQSLASGPNYDTWDLVRAYLADTKDVQRAQAFTWGREGEFSLCLAIYEAEASGKVLEDIKSIIQRAPATPGGPTRAERGNLTRPSR